MSKIILDLQPIYTTKEIEVLGNKVEVKTYLPIEEKLNIVELVLQECIEFNFVNTIKAEAIFNSMICIKYTNIDLSNYTEDMYNLYDIVETNGLLQQVIDVCFEDYQELRNMLDEMINKYEGYENSISGIINKTLLNLPEKLKEAMDELDNLDTGKLLSVYNDIAENGGNQNAIIEAIVGKRQK